MPDDLILHHGELLNYFIIYHNIIIEIKCIINVICLNHTQTIPPSPALWKNCLPWNLPLVPDADCCPHRHAGIIFQKAGQGILAPDSQAEGCLGKIGHTHDLSWGSGRTGGLTPVGCRGYKHRTGETGLEVWLYLPEIFFFLSVKNYLMGFLEAVNKRARVF